MRNGIEKIKQNWTPFPNCILDNIEKYTPAEFKVLSLMIRKNEGYSNPNKMFSAKYVALKCGINKETALKALSGLLKKDAIKIISTGDRGVRHFDINWIEPVENSDRSEKPTRTGRKNQPEPVGKTNPLKENKVKDNILKENNSDFSEELEILEYYNSKNTGQAEPAKENTSILKLIRATLKVYPKAKLKKAIDNMYKDPWSIENKQIRLNRLIKSDKRDSNIFRYAGNDKALEINWVKL